MIAGKAFMSIQTLHVTGHAIDGLARDDGDSRVSRHVNWVVRPTGRDMLNWLKDIMGQKSEATADTLWAAAILAECASADKVLDDSLEPKRATERPLIMAVLQSLLAHAAWRALTVATPKEAFSICTALCEELAGRSSLPPGHFAKVWAVVFQLLTQQPTTAKNAESLWARIAFAVGDAGYVPPHVYDLLWVQYTVLVYPNFNIRVFEAAGGRDAQMKPSPKQAASALATANAELHRQLRSLAEKVMGDNIGNAEIRRKFGAVLMEKNLREIQGIE
jgi:hypothetical protein